MRSPRKMRAEIEHAFTQAGKEAPCVVYPGCRDSAFCTGQILSDSTERDRWIWKRTSTPKNMAHVQAITNSPCQQSRRLMVRCGGQGRYLAAGRRGRWSLRRANIQSV